MGAFLWTLFIVVLAANVWLTLDKRRKDREKIKALEQRRTFWEKPR